MYRVRQFKIAVFYALLMGIAMLVGLSYGSVEKIPLARIFHALGTTFSAQVDHSVDFVIITQIRLPRVILAGACGAALSLGGLVFQALLRNALAEPYILGVSGGSAIGAIGGILLGLAPFPGVAFTAFGGSMAVLGLVLLMAMGAAGRPAVNKDSLLLGGVMMNAFCAAVIMFLISVSRSSQLHHILFWLMGDFSSVSLSQLPPLLALVPCFFLIFLFGRPLNLLLMGRDTAAALGTDVLRVTLLLLAAASLMISIVVSQSGLIGFVGLVIPHILRNIHGTDHRLLVPACLFGGGGYMILCDLLARMLPATGEMPVGIITALIGAPVFVFLLWREKR
jgi:iron complex transport system permease protein